MDASPERHPLTQRHIEKGAQHTETHHNLFNDAYPQSHHHTPEKGHNHSHHGHLPKMDLYDSGHHKSRGKQNHHHKGHHPSSEGEPGEPKGSPEGQDNPGAKPGGRAEKLAEAEATTAKKTHTIGWCAGSVEQTLGKFGIHVGGNAADTLSSFRGNSQFQEVPPGQMKRGDVCVRGKSASHPNGHIFVYLGGGMEASDHIQSLTNSSVYGQSHVFRLA